MAGSNIVYYYCDTMTGLSILKNKQLWLTSIRNMNDSNEEISIYEIFCKKLGINYICLFDYLFISS